MHVAVDAVPTQDWSVPLGRRFRALSIFVQVVWDVFCRSFWNVQVWKWSPFEFPLQNDPSPYFEGGLNMFKETSWRSFSFFKFTSFCFQWIFQDWNLGALDTVTTGSFSRRKLRNLDGFRVLWHLWCPGLYSASCRPGEDLKGFFYTFELPGSLEVCWPLFD